MEPSFVGWHCVLHWFRTQKGSPLTKASTRSATAVSPPLRLVHGGAKAPLNASPLRVYLVVQPECPLASLRALSRARDLARNQDTSWSPIVVLPAALHRLARVTPRAIRDVADHVRNAAQRASQRGPLSALRARLHVAVGAGYAPRLVEDALVARATDDERTPLVVVGASPEVGDVWVRLARRTGVAVFIARRRRKPAAEILAATDFSDHRFPTHRAASWVGCGSNRVTLLHNLDPKAAEIARTKGVALSPSAIDTLRDLRAHRIHEVARSATGGAVLTTNADPMSAVLEHARRNDSDVVVLGARRDRARRHSPPRRTAEVLATCLRRSVLVVPLDRR